MQLIYNIGLLATPTGDHAKAGQRHAGVQHQKHTQGGEHSFAAAKAVK